MKTAIGRGVVRGEALADALFADWLALEHDAVVEIDTPAAWAGVVRRIGARASRLHLLHGSRFGAADAVALGIADALVPAGADPLEWMRGRSVAALDSAASLVRRGGGDALERAEFARLFATGEPRRGLTAFLEKRRPDWSRNE